MTPEGHKRLKEELSRLKAERPRIVREIAAAREHGDLSENAEYHAAKDRQGLTEARILELEAKLGGAEVIDTSTLSGDRVQFGATVSIVDEDTEPRAPTSSSAPTRPTRARAGSPSPRRWRGRWSASPPAIPWSSRPPAAATPTRSPPSSTAEPSLLRFLAGQGQRPSLSAPRDPMAAPIFHMAPARPARRPLQPRGGGRRLGLRHRPDAQRPERRSRAPPRRHRRPDPKRHGQSQDRAWLPRPRLRARRRRAGLSHALQGGLRGNERGLRDLLRS